MGHRALGIGHGALGMGHWEWGMGHRAEIEICLYSHCPLNNCPLPDALLPITHYPFSDLFITTNKKTSFVLSFRIFKYNLEKSRKSRKIKLIQHKSALSLS
jgi:hypothetical protein